MDKYEIVTSSRSKLHVLSLFVCFGFISFSIIFIILFVGDNEAGLFLKIIGCLFFSILLAIGVGGFSSTILRFFKPVYWKIGITENEFYWDSQMNPKTIRNFKLDDIDKINLDFGDVEDHYLILNDGIKHKIPSICAYKSTKLLPEIYRLKKNIKLYLNGTHYGHIQYVRFENKVLKPTLKETKKYKKKYGEVPDESAIKELRIQIINPLIRFFSLIFGLFLLVVAFFLFVVEAFLFGSICTVLGFIFSIFGLRGKKNKVESVIKNLGTTGDIAMILDAIK